jgi:glucose-1-phosphatase
MAIRSIVCDVGGVLVRTEDPGPRRKWEERLSLPAGDLVKVVFDNPVAQRATVGEATREEVWVEVGRTLSISTSDLQQLRLDFFAGDRWDLEFLAYLEALHGTLRTGILSNAWLGAREDQAAWIHPGLFDFILYSGEQHCRKPDPAFFHMAVQSAACPPEEVVFIDDFMENVDAADALGIQGLLFRRLTDIRDYVGKNQ